MRRTRARTTRRTPSRAIASAPPESSNPTFARPSARLGPEALQNLERLENLGIVGHLLQSKPELFFAFVQIPSLAVGQAQVLMQGVDGRAVAAELNRLAKLSD